MYTAAIICITLFFVLALQVKHLFNKMKVHDGSVESFGIVVYGPLMILAGLLAVLFSVCSFFYL